MENLNRYLLYGDTNPIEPSPTVEVKDYEWDELKILFRENLIKSLFKIESRHLSFCGTTSGLVMKDLLGDLIYKLWAFDGISIDPLMDREHQYASFDVDNIENYLIAINHLSDTPRCSMEDIFAFHRQKQMSKELDTVYCEGGTDFLFLGFNVVASMMCSLFRRKQYDIAKAMKYLNGPSRIGIAAKPPEIHAKIFRDNFFYFTYDELKEFGIEPPDDIIDVSTQATFMTSFFDLGYHMVYKRRTKVFGDHFGLKIYSPFYNDPEFVNFCLSIPMEMKYCMGRKKHILKESFDLSQYRKLPHLDLERSLYNHIRNEIERLAYKYLTNKGNRIFDYLPFDVVQKYLKHDSKRTIVLLNLAIWLEVH